MTATELAGYRLKLEALGRRLQSNLPGLRQEALRAAGGEESGSLSNSPLHLADLGTDHYEQEMALSLLETQGARLEEIADALRRIEAGTYGRCQQCRRDIPRPRLEAIPYTRYCVTCATKLQTEATPEQGAAR
jgi:RNA polymerase-binding transcription factor DksA